MPRSSTTAARLAPGEYYRPDDPLFPRWSADMREVNRIEHRVASLGNIADLWPAAEQAEIRAHLAKLTARADRLRSRWYLDVQP